MSNNIPGKSKRLFSFQSGRNWSEHLSFVMQIGLTMAGCIIFCFFLGRYLDDVLGLKGIMVTILTILGVVGGANTVYRQILEMTDRDRKYATSRNRKDI